MEIEIWSDVVCPWCYIGKRRFDRALETFRSEHPEVATTVRYRAFQLDPAAPVGVSHRVSEVYAEKFGGRDQAQALMAKVTEEAAKEGITFELEKAQRSNTADAHRLLALSFDHEKQDALKERLMRAYFTEGEAIGERSTLVRLASDVGIPSEVARTWLDTDRGSAELESDKRTATGLGITSVPTFVFNRSSGVAGAHPSSQLLSVLRQAAGLV